LVLVIMGHTQREGVFYIRAFGLWLSQKHFCLCLIDAGLSQPWRLQVYGTISFGSPEDEIILASDGRKPSVPVLAQR